MTFLNIILGIVLMSTYGGVLAAERWQPLTADVMYDATTFTTEKDNDGDRVTVTWIKFTNQKSEEVLIKTKALCKYRVLNAWSYITIRKDGNREKIESSITMDTTPGGPWEPTLIAICAKAKPWWQVL